MNTITLSDINQRAKNPQEFIRQCEESFDSKIKDLAVYIKKHGIRFIFLSGPTSSGKTTFTKKLRYELSDGAIYLSLDDYYKSIDNMPKRKDGEYNFETVNAIELKNFRDDFRRLMNGEQVFLPALDFVNKKKIKQKKPVRLCEDGMIITEGLHALNEKVFGVCAENTLKIFICPLTKLYCGDKAISPYDIRFIRRMVRDDFFRNSGAEASLRMWPVVRAGEKIYMENYKDNADFLVDTFVPYELCAMKNIALKQLDGVEQSLKVRRLKNILKGFSEVDFRLIPENSILNEFIKINK